MPWWVLFGGVGLLFVLVGARFLVVGRRAAPGRSRGAELSTADRDLVMGSALFTVLGLLLSGFGIVVLMVTAMLVRALA